MKLKSNWNKVFIGLIAIIFFACDSAPKKTPKDTVITSSVEVADTIAEEEVESYFSKKIKTFYPKDIADYIVSRWPLDSSRQLEHNYQSLYEIAQKMNSSEHISFDKYWKNIMNDTVLTKQSSPLMFICSEECTVPYVSINTEDLRSFCNQLNQRDSAFLDALTYTFNHIESDYPNFMEQCDECFGATSNIGDLKILDFYKKSAPFKEDTGFYAKRIDLIRSTVLNLAISNTFRFDKNKVLQELNEWKNLNLLKTNELIQVDSLILKINSDTTIQFNYSSEDYSLMYN